MSNYQSLSHRYLFSKLSKYAENGFTGRLNIKIENVACWHIYFNTGAIIWASGGVHPVRRWLRQLKGCHCQVSVPEGVTKEELLSSPHECWDYFALTQLMQENHIHPEQVKYIVEGVISEVLFDVVQAFAKLSATEVEQIKMYRKQEVAPCDKQILPWTWRTETAKERILLMWQSWAVAGLDQFSPDTGVIANQEELKKQKFNSLTKYFLKIEAEEKTLRDLAVESERNVLSILRTMKSYFNQNLIQFRSVSDLWQSSQHLVPQPSQADQEHFTGVFSPVGKARSMEEVTKIYLKPDGASSTAIQPQPTATVCKSDQEGVTVNVMEVLVSQEVDRQLRIFPSHMVESINRLDVVTYALNRLPPLYAATKEGIAHQKEEAKRHYQEAIIRTVQQAIEKVQQNPIRPTSRIMSPDEVPE